MDAMKDEDGKDRVPDWENGLPSAAELIPLSHSLISGVLSRAFCIPASPTPAVPGSPDVLHASQATLQLLQKKSTPSFPLPSFDPYSSYEAGRGGGAFGREEGIDEDRVGYDSLRRNKDESGRRSVRVTKSPMLNNKGSWDSEKGQERDGGGSSSGIGGTGNVNSGPEFGQAFYWPAHQGVLPATPGPYGSLGSDQGGYGGLESGEGASLDKTRKVGDTESEDVDSADGPDGNTARTLKRPRLVWTPQLHKRFVDAVGHLGIKNAVPKTIMQLMNVEGLTRENVASHLQKYRLYLKRMQGLSNEGPSASDPLFASAPLPPNLTTSHFFSNHHHSRGENGATGPPFSPPASSLPRTQGTLPSGPIGPGSVQHFGAFEYHPYNIGLARTAPHMGHHHARESTEKF